MNDHRFHFHDIYNFPEIVFNNGLTPAIDYQALATSMGIPSIRIHNANKISDAVSQSISQNTSGSSLIEVMIAPSANV